MENTKNENLQITSSWANGSFYLSAFVIIISLLGYLAGKIPPYTLALIISAGILIVPIIGALQLRQDKRLSEKYFLELMRMVLGQLPLVSRFTGKQEKSEEHGKLE